MERYKSCILFYRISSRFQLYVYFCFFYGCVFSESGNFSTICLVSDGLSLSNPMLTIVSLNCFSQSIPSSGVISFRSVITICFFCLLFPYSMSASDFPGILLVLVHIVALLFHFLEFGVFFIIFVCRHYCFCLSGVYYIFLFKSVDFISVVKNLFLYTVLLILSTFNIIYIYIYIYK